MTKKIKAIKMLKKIEKRYFLILLLPLGYIINLLSRSNRLATEKYYSNFIYRGISWLLGKITGLLPISLVELLFISLLIFVPIIFVFFIIKLIKGREKRLKLIVKGLLNIALAISIIYFSFIAMWGLNYNRLTLGEIMGLEVKPSSVKELRDLTEDLARKVNSLRPLVEENESGVMVPFGGYKGGFKRYKEGYKAVAEYHPELGGVVSRAKPILSSKLYAYTGIWGIYSPFTVESNVNMEIPTPMFLSTMMHELAHQAGFAREDEANYIAFITCINHPDPDFQYSGYLLGLNYSLNALYAQDSKAYKIIFEQLDKGVKLDLYENNNYHDKYSGKLSKATSKTNDAFLKANDQEDGEKSYGRMLDLMLAEYRQKNNK